uniref:Anaphase-promoting complex subunit 4 WD40 domain-containing protein n=1 Tax=Globisporangium ultimum (strain ATCC 200006 / CBS 805.95 / DAOM BR144) TaxID=431595 RepID=K3X4Q4_GLOUD
MRHAAAADASPPQSQPPSAPHDAASAEAEISALLKAANGLAHYSPCGGYVAAAHGNRVTLRETRTLQIVQRYTTVDVIQAIAWSDDSQVVATAMYKRAMVQIWSVKDSSFTCKISEGLAGMVYGKWAPDSRHFITVSDFQLHATVWSLVDGVKYVIRSPKLGADGFAFSPAGDLLAVAERHDCKDFIGVYDCASWELVAHFALESYDCVEILWSPDNATIAVRDSHLEFRVLLYAVDGTLLAKYQAYEHALGLKSMIWSTSGHFLALGSFDEHVRVLSHLNWQPIAEFDHETIAVTLTRVNKTAVEYEEHFAGTQITQRPQGKRIPIGPHASSSLLSNSSLAASAAAQAAGGRKSREICFVVREPPFSVLTITSDPLKENPKMGIGRVLWSADAAFLASKSDQMPHNVWIWRMETMTLHSVVSLMQPVRSLRWDPVNCRLAICSGENRVHLWSPGGVSWVDIPVDAFKAISFGGSNEVQD